MATVNAEGAEIGDFVGSTAEAMLKKKRCIFSERACKVFGLEGNFGVFNHLF